MARWVSAEDDAGDWWRLVFFADGWVELPGFARGLSDTREQLRTFSALLAGVVGLGVAGRLVGDVPGLGWLGSVLLLGALGLLVWSAVLRTRFRRRDWRQADGDVAQARAAKAAGQQLRRRPGAPLWRRARSSAQYVSWVDGVRRVGAESVSRVDVAGPGADGLVVATVVRHDGSVLHYRTPDRAAVACFAAWVRS